MYEIYIHIYAYIHTYIHAYIICGYMYIDIHRATMHLTLGTSVLSNPSSHTQQDLPKALARLAFTAAVSAVLSFVAGLGDRHHENFMVTVDGRLVPPIP